MQEGKASINYLPTHMLGLGDISDDKLKAFVPEDAFLVVKSQRPARIQRSRYLTADALANRQERAAAVRQYERFLKVDRIHEYLRRITLKVIDCQLAQLQARIDLVNSMLRKGEICKQLLMNKQAEFSKLIYRYHFRYEQARVRRMIIGEAYTRFCKVIGNVEINSIA